MQQPHLPNALSRALAWKEWQQWRGGFALYTAGLISLLFYDLAYRRNRINPLPNFVVWQMFWGAFVPVLIGVAAACDDMARNTLSYTQSLPCSLKKVAWFRLGGATMVLIGPPLLTSLLLLGGLAAFDHPSLSKMIAIRPTLLQDFWKALLLLWSEQLGILLLVSLVSARCRSETLAGAYGAAIVGFHLFLRALAYELPSEMLKWYYLLFPAELVNPISRRVQHPPGLGDTPIEQIWQPLVIHWLFLSVLAIWFTRRYGSAARSTPRKSLSAWFGIRGLPQSMFHPASPLASLVWINLRQAFPLILAGWLMLIPVMFMLLPTNQGLTITLERSLCFVGVFWPAMIGSGLFATELRSNLGQFWRSRPISSRRWFWVKYFVGLILVIVALDLIPVLLGSSILAIYSAFDRTSGGLNWSIFGVYLACYPAIHAASYTLAVLGVCWIRKPALVVALSVTSLMAIDLTLKVNKRLDRFSPYAHAASLEVLAYTDRDPWEYVGREFAITWGAISLLTGAGACAASRAANRNEVKSFPSWLAALWGKRRTSVVLETSPSTGASSINP